MKGMKKKEIRTLHECVEPHRICGHFGESEIIWNILRLEPGHSIIIEAVNNNEYTLTKDKEDMYADVIRSNTYFWRPLSDYDGLNPIPNETKSKVNVSKKIIK